MCCVALETATEPYSEAVNQVVLYKRNPRWVNFPSFLVGADSRSLGVISLHETATFTWRCVPCGGDFGHWMQLGDLGDVTNMCKSWSVQQDYPWDIGTTMVLYCYSDMYCTISISWLHGWWMERKEVIEWSWLALSKVGECWEPLGRAGACILCNYLPCSLSLPFSMAYGKKIEYDSTWWYILWISFCRGFWGTFSWCPSSSSKGWFGIFWPHLACRHGAQVNRSVATQRVCMFPKQRHFFSWAQVWKELQIGSIRYSYWFLQSQMPNVWCADVTWDTCCVVVCWNVRHCMVEPDTTALAVIVDGTELLLESKGFCDCDKFYVLQYFLMLWDGKIVLKFNCCRQFGSIASLKPQVSHCSSGPAAPSWDGKCEGATTLGLMSSSSTNLQRHHIGKPWKTWWSMRTPADLIWIVDNLRSAGISRRIASTSKGPTSFSMQEGGGTWRQEIDTDTLQESHLVA